jgi:hypothetical protein
MASPFSSPPIKKQRASGTPPMMMQQQQQQQQHHQTQQNHDAAAASAAAAVSQRRAQLLKLAQTNQNQPSASTLMNQARTSLMSPPIGASAAAAYSSSAMAAAAGPPPTKLMVPSSSHISTARTASTTMNGTTSTNYSHNHNGSSNGINGTAAITMTSSSSNRQPGSALRGGGRPSPPNNNPENAVPSPASPKPAVFLPHHPGALLPSTPSAPESTSNTDARLARRLGSEFANQTANASGSASSTTTTTTGIPTPSSSRSKSAPPSRRAPPPPPPPRARAQEEPIVKAVSFRSPEDTTTTTTVQQQPETPELTKGGRGNGGPPVTPGHYAHQQSHAGSTPAPPPRRLHNAGSTPFHSEVLATPTTHDKQAMFRSLQDIADTPHPGVTSTPESTTTTTTTFAATTTTNTTPTITTPTMTTPTTDVSPELRLQQHLASTMKEKAEAFHMVAQLEGKLTKSNVQFLSPLLGSRPEPKRYTKSPLPKRLTDRFTGQGRSPPVDDPAVLKAAAASVSYEFTRDDRTYTLRRPYGLAGEEKDLWCKVGHLPAKVYERQANVDDETSFEVAATCNDGSVLNLYGDHFVRHHTLDEGPHEYEDQSLTTMLGNIAYVDDNGVDQFYSLDDIWGTAMEVRGLYRTSLRAAADALLLTPLSSMLPATTAANDSAAHGSSTNGPAPKTTTVDTGMTTDPLPKPKDTAPTTTTPPPPTVMENEPGALPSVFGKFFRYIFWFLFFVVKTTGQCIIGTIYLSMAFVFVSIMYLRLKNDHGADEMGAIATIYQNGGGIV